MEKNETIPKLEGTLTAFSHTFILCQDVFFLMEIYGNGCAYHIMVRHPSQQQWRCSLRIGCRYRITDLLTHALYKGKLPILVARRTSYLLELTDDQKHNDVHGVSDNRNLVSYKGVVTAPVDQALGIWELDGNIHLVVSFLCDITGEIWIGSDDDCPGDAEDARGSASSKRSRNQYLKVGDSVSIYEVHFSKILGRTYLTSCGRSLMMINRTFDVKRSITRSASSILDILHMYNPSISGLSWLIGIERRLVAALAPKFAQADDILRRNGNREQSFLYKLIEAGTCRGLMKVESRSLVKEFLLHDDQCFLEKKSTTPFTLVRIKEVIAEVNVQENAESITPRIWNQNISEREQSRCVVGKLCSGNSGVLQIQDVSDSADILILGVQTQILEGSVVALFNFSVAVEEFSIWADGDYHKIQKRYIIIDVSGIVVLKRRDRPKEVVQPYTEINITVISKSNVIYIQPQIANHYLSLEKFYIAKVVLSLTTPEGRVEKWDNFVRFCGNIALAHSCIEVGHSYTIHTGVKNPGVDLKKTFTNIWFQSLQGYFGTSECIYMPEGTVLVDMSPGQHHSNSVDIRSLLKTDFIDDGPITVIGVIKDRQLMTPKFDSEVSTIPLNLCNDHHIGVPGSKILRILVCDSLENTNSMIWIYFNGPYNQFIPQYPLGVLPGIKFSLSCLLRKVSKKTKHVYLQCTHFSLFTALSLPIPKATSCEKSHQYLKYAFEQQGPFQVIAHIECIQKVIFRIICGGCKSEMNGGSCSYVGCSSPDGGRLATYGHVLIDDGSGTALMSMDSPKHLKLLLQLTDDQYNTLSQEIIQSCRKQTFHYLQHYNSKGEKDENYCEAFEKLCSRSELSRPLRFECRLFNQQNEDLANLYCLDVFDLNPEKDVKIWEAKITLTMEG